MFPGNRENVLWAGIMLHLSKNNFLVRGDIAHLRTEWSSYWARIKLCISMTHVSCEPEQSSCWAAVKFLLRSDKFLWSGIMFPYELGWRSAQAKMCSFKMDNVPFEQWYDPLCKGLCSLWKIIMFPVKRDNTFCEQGLTLFWLGIMFFLSRDEVPCEQILINILCTGQSAFWAGIKLLVCKVKVPNAN
jgi:hypothetical protein